MNKKTAIGNVVLILISLLFALGISEIVIRMLNLAPEVVYIEKWRVRLSDNPKIGFEPIPNLDSAGKDVRYYSYDGRANSLGYRDYDHPLKKPAGSERVIVIGDSVTAGLWINEDDKVYTSVMESTLHQEGFNADVMNFGVSGYNTQQEVETLRERGLQYSPDLVVLAYCLNDRWRDDGGIYGLLLDEERKQSQNKDTVNTSTISPAIRNSALVRFLKFVVFAPKEEDKVQSNFQDPVDFDKFNKDVVTEYFGELSQLANEHNFDVLVIIFPDFGKQDEELKKGFAEYQYAQEHNTIQKLAKANGFNLFDLYQPFQECRDTLGNNVSYDRYHPNPDGSVCIGAKIAKHIIENGYIQAKK